MRTPNYYVEDKDNCNLCWWHWLILIFVILIFILVLIYLITVIVFTAKVNKVIKDLNSKVTDIIDNIKEPVFGLINKVNASGIPQKIGKNIENVASNISDVTSNISDVTRNVRNVTGNVARNFANN